MKKHALNLGSFILFFSILIPFALDAQYFGRNKPHYKTFDYKLYETPILVSTTTWTIRKHWIG